MEEFDQQTITHLRSMARGGATASQMLRHVLCSRAPEEPHKIALIRLMRTAFALSLSEAKPIGGWYQPEEVGLSDAELDAFLDPDIRRHQREWDQARAS
jgi:hypothetical protein